MSPFSRSRRAWAVHGIVLLAMLSGSLAHAGDLFFRKHRGTAVPVVAQPVPVQQAVVAAPVQLAYGAAAQAVPVQMSYVQLTQSTPTYIGYLPTVQAPHSYTAYSTQATTVPAPAPVLNIRLEAPPNPVPSTPAPQAGKSPVAPANQAPTAQASYTYVPGSPTTIATYVLPQAAIAAPLYVAPATRTGFLKNCPIFRGK
jgi:hypothetical protein